MTLMPTQSAPLRRTARRTLSAVSRTARVLAGRAELHLRPGRRSFVGAYPSAEAALAAVPRNRLAGYAHADITDVCFEDMCRVTIADYPVLYWLSTLVPDVTSVLDVGGHMGTKYRAFDPLLNLSERTEWTVLETAPMAEAGARRAARDGLDRLAFISEPAQAPRCDLVFASGLFQYYGGTPQTLLDAIGYKPRHLILNKVAVRGGPMVVTLERIGASLVPYQIRDRTDFLGEIDRLGYDTVDRWTIPSLSHTIRSHPELGASESMGLCLRLRADHASETLP